jgi:hypothetical protein
MIDSTTGHLPSELSRSVADTTFFIGADVLSEAYRAGKTLRSMLDGGGFVYLSPGCFVINHPRYVTSTERGMELTEYAREHLDECCLRFRVVSKPTQPSLQKSDAPSAQRKRERPYSRVPVFVPDTHNIEVFNRSEDSRKFHADLLEDARFMREIEIDFAQLAAGYIRRKGFNKVVFCDKTHLSEKTYERIMRDEVPNPALETVMALCLGLSLRAEDSERLLERAGYRLNSSPLHMAYRRLLSCHVGRSIDECNELLEALGLPLLGSRRG